MVYGLWQSAAGMAANQYRQNIAANNLANIDTIGFKHDLAMLRERPVESREDADAGAYANMFYDHLSGGTVVRETMHSFTQGPTIPTGQPLDAMIDGQGFFSIETDDGERYTRDGRFARNDDGLLVTFAGGHAVLDDGGATITIPSGGLVKIDSAGMVRQGDTTIATIGVVEFDDVNMLRKVGGNKFIATQGAQPRPAVDSEIVPGALEGSTIDPVSALVEMIKTARAFQMNANLLSAQDSTLGRAVNEIARF